MKTTGLLFRMIALAALMGRVGYAGPLTGNATAPIPAALRDLPASRNAARVETPVFFHSMPSEPAWPLLKIERHPGPGTAKIGGAANPAKAGLFITGAANAARNTAVVSGTGMNHQP
jgi:hypothetical protein